MKKLFYVLAVGLCLAACSKDEDPQPANADKTEVEYIMKIYSDQKFNGDVEWVELPYDQYQLFYDHPKITFTNHKVLTDVMEYTLTFKVPKAHSVKIRLTNMSHIVKFYESFDGVKTTARDYNPSGMEFTYTNKI